MFKNEFRTICFALLLVLTLSLIAGCTPAATPITEPAVPTVAPVSDSPTTAPAAQNPAPAGKSYTIGVSSFQLGNDWNIQVADGAKAQITAKGWQEVHTNAEGDSNAQITALEGFLSQKVDGVVVAGGSGPALIPAIQKLVAAKIPVVCIDITVPEAVTNIYPDTYMTTELLSVFMVNKLQAQPGVYAHVTIPGLGWKTVDIRDNVADLVFKTEGWTNTGLVDSGLADAITQTATGIRSTLLAHPELNLVYSSWGNPAIGAANAIREAGLQSKVFVVNTDADRGVLAEMAKPDSPIVAVIGQEPLLEGQMAIDALGRAFNGDTNIPKISFAPFVFVTKEPALLPPGVQTVMDPTSAWTFLYPNVPFGQLK
jgi:ABC-type sugar transport system substrate-binding protein